MFLRIRCKGTHLLSIVQAFSINFTPLLTLSSIDGLLCAAASSILYKRQWVLSRLSDRFACAVEYHFYSGDAVTVYTYNLELKAFEVNPFM